MKVAEGVDVERAESGNSWHFLDNLGTALLYGRGDRAIGADHCVSSWPRIRARSASAASRYRHTSQGTGPPFYKIGKHNRWKRSEVLAWFDSHSQ
jgi:hypothetical protein